MTGSGQRQERVTFQQRALDENGDRLGDWEDDVKRWARVRVLKGGEPVLQARLQGVQPVEVIVLSTTSTQAITTAWRVLWKSVPYNIRSIAPGEDRSEIAFMAEADQSDG